LLVLLVNLFSLPEHVLEFLARTHRLLFGNNSSSFPFPRLPLCCLYYPLLEVASRLEPG
jgi:hypothetical protein